MVEGEESGGRRGQKGGVGREGGEREEGLTLFWLVALNLESFPVNGILKRNYFKLHVEKHKVLQFA